MSLLLDTHVVVWWLTQPAELPDDRRARLREEPDVYLSAVSLWEVAIKQAVGKITNPPNLLAAMGDAGFRPLPITAEHAVATVRLPLLHRDPFDRILIAQAQCAGLTLVTRDRQIQRYDVDLLRL